MYSNRDEITDHSRNTSAHTIHAAVTEQPVASMPQLTEIERQQLSVWNATRQNYSRDACVHQLVARQAAATPGAVAVVMGDQVLSYGELNERANQLGHFLQTLGVGLDVLVGLCIECSLDMVVGLLGILKAGGAYVPLDPVYPPERLAFMLHDAQVSVLVTKRHLVTRLPAEGARVVCLDADAALLAQQSANDPVAFQGAVYPRPENLAYVIYTSGSTGQPKGVQVTHNSLLNLVFWHQRAFDLSPSDRATQVTSPAFDATGWELWPYLTIGARVYLPDEDTRTLPILLRDWLVSQHITITFLPTALAESVMALEWPATTSLRFLLTGADTLHHYPPPGLPFTLINNYGPTEATVVATSGRILPAEQNGVPPTIGRPIANTQLYILDEYLRQVPIGMMGELYIGGVGLARGYLNRPELTAEKFIPHPFSSDPEGAPRVLRSLAEMTEYFRAAVRKHQDHPRDDLISAFLVAEQEGDRLTEEEVVANSIMVMTGGQETTTNLIGNGILTLLRHPDQLEKLRDLALLIFMLYGVTTLVEEAPRFSVLYRHEGYTEYILRTCTVDPSLDAYFNWPGFFILSAFVTRLTGYHDIFGFGLWAPVFFNLIYLGPLYMLFTSATTDKRTVWLGLWFFYITNWIGQGYFLPQGLNFFLYLVIIAILLRWFKVAPSAQSLVQEPRGQHPGRIQSFVHRFFAWLRAPDTVCPSVQPRQRAALLVILITIFAFVVFSHPLTRSSYWQASLLLSSFVAAPHSGCLS